MPGETVIDLSAVRKFINAELLYREDQQLDREANLIEGGVLDSMTLIRLISFLEEHYGIDIPDQDILPDNFRSMNAIETFLARHVGAAKPETKSKGSSQ